jgi:ABC-type branched-subunit amino acid transport system ATPase component
MALLEVLAVTKVYGPLKALGGVDLKVEASTFHGLIGPNGSGKSTLLKSIAGAHYPTTGTITFDGVDITSMPPYQRARQGLSLKFQITAVLSEMSVYDNVLLALQSMETPLQLLQSRSRRSLDNEVMHVPIKKECALIIVEHDLDFIKNICDRLTVLDQGRVIGDGTVADIERDARVQEIYTSRV